MANCNALPTPLKSKLSSEWIRNLESLEKNSCVLNAASDQDLDRKEDSLEDVLEAMLSEEAIENNGKLELKPIFTRLSPALQARFLFLVRSNICRLNRQQLKVFVEKMESEIPLPLWTKEAIRQLKNSVQDSCDDAILLPNKVAYEFTSESTQLLQDILVKAVVKKEEKLSTSSGSLNRDITNVAIAQPNREWLNSSKAVDVIVIDDDSIDYLEPTDKASLCRASEIDSTEINHLDKQPCDDIAGKVTLITKNPRADYIDTAGKTHVRDGTESQHSNLHEHVLLNSSDIGASKMMDDALNSHEKESLSDDIKEPLKKCQKLETPSKMECDTGKEEDKEGTIEMVNLENEVKTQLSSLKEICFSKEKKIAISGEMLSCLVRLSKTEMTQACELMELPYLTEKMLVNLCDTMPWASIGFEPAVEFLTCCLISKVVTLESQPTHTLLTVVASVAKIQPKVLVSVLVHILYTTNSGEFQCQFVASVCKNYLPSECFCFLLKQLCTENVVMNEHLSTVLQTIIDRKPDLDPDSLAHLVTLLSQAPNMMNSNAKFGKLLFAIISKYGKKMTSDPISTVSILADSHSSSVRKMLLAAVKKISK